MFSPAGGGSGSSASRTRRSPAWSAPSGFDLAHEAARRASATMATKRSVMLFMAALRRSRDAEARSAGALQRREPLLVGGEMGCEVHLMHAQLLGAVEDHGEIGPARRVARLRAAHGILRDGNQLVVERDVAHLREYVGMML